VSRRVRMILIGIGVVILAGLVWFFVLSPIRGDIADIQTEMETQQGELVAAQAQLAQAEVTREQGRENQARLLELAKMVPGTEEIPSLLLQLQDLADQSGITFMSISPGDAQANGEAWVIPLDLQFSGTFFDVSDFVYRAEKMVAGPGRLLAIKTLDLTVGVGGTTELAGAVSPELSVSMTIYAFVAGSPAGVAPAADTTATTQAPSQ
jgi:Tfp pilus assembly protein PilO